MLVLTGPNYSGKSVYLKQVALIVFMAHVGSFVPAESARIGLTDKILSRVTTRETVSRVQSTFMLDLQQISLALNLATRRSLLIIDEFGKGTEASDGAGLACAVMEHLLSLGTERPKVIGATHFHGRRRPVLSNKQTLTWARNLRDGFSQTKACPCFWSYGGPY
jgi:DNA mismatch repair protein MSH5